MGRQTTGCSDSRPIGWIYSCVDSEQTEAWTRVLLPVLGEPCAQSLPQIPPFYTNPHLCAGDQCVLTIRAANGGGGPGSPAVAGRRFLQA